MGRMLNGTIRRLGRLEAILRPSPDVLTPEQVRLMSDGELCQRYDDLLAAAVGPIAAFETLEAFIGACHAYFGESFDQGQLREPWDRARWLQHHAPHGPFRYGPRWTQRPLLSCACGGHLKIYRAVVPPEFWDRITEDDEPRTEPYYPPYRETPQVKAPEG